MVGQAGIEPAYEKFIRLPDATSLPFVRCSQQKLDKISVLINGQCNPIKAFGLAPPSGIEPPSVD